MRNGMMVFVALLSAAAVGQDLSGIKLNPGERIIAINGVPVNGAVQPRGRSAVPATSQRSATPVRNAAARTAASSLNIAGNLVRSGRPFSHSPGNSALDKANHERQRQGMRPLLPDPQLQQLAMRKATIAAQRRYKNHVGGSLGGAKCEGVGFTQGRFLSCCLDEPGTYGGAAMVQGPDGWYCCLLVR